MAQETTDDCLRQFLNDDSLVKKIRSAKVLMVGAGGIGCEVIKTMMLSGFMNFNVIDLDTIDVSNLNRQFLFNKSHVKKSKAEVACEVAKERFGHKDTGKEIIVKAILDPVQKPEFDVEFFKSHTLVINALDNRAARNHVNRMCLAADVPLIESGTEGYIGQVFVIKKGSSACYECDGPKQEQKTYASCTIRNTPSLPIHCITWGKHLFSQLFGESDPDNDVSPDVNDPELQNGAPTNGSNGNGHNGNTNGPEKLPSTRVWAEENNYDPKMLFEKLFEKDIEYLLKMDKLWETRAKPTPLAFSDLDNYQPKATGSSNNGHSSKSDSDALEDQRSWTLRECYEKFAESVLELKSRLTNEPFLVWDKDDDPALNFVVAVSNIRSYNFNIEQKSKFDVKSMAGNIIPAISSTNAVIGGIITLQAINILDTLKEVTSEGVTSLKCTPEDIYDKCRHVYLRQNTPSANNLVASYELSKPNPKCLVCADSREVKVQTKLSETTMGTFTDQIIMSKLGFVCPDIQIDGEATVIWSKDDADDETPEEKLISSNRKLIDLPQLRNGTRLKVYDLIQNLSIIVTLEDIEVDPALNDGLSFKLVVTNEGSAPKEEEPMAASSSKDDQVFTVDDDEIMVEPQSGDQDAVTALKLKRGSEDVSDSPVKKLKT